MKSLVLGSEDIYIYIYICVCTYIIHTCLSLTSCGAGGVWTKSKRIVVVLLKKGVKGGGKRKLTRDKRLRLATLTNFFKKIC